ncbi:TetR/AcrR family transcriptional regulator [Clostridium sardiniense]|uniref:TetR/AcrR family transcriptional regulator n=1 Tax=Clostridium sardiniense TaxID=29369 RepID=UPI003D334309
MPPKNKFSKEQIIDAAFEIAREEGMDSITIRKVASKLKSSIAPIYVNFNEVDELKMAVISKVQEISTDMIVEQNTGDAFFDIGIASIKFAKNYSTIFKDLLLKESSYLEVYNENIMPIIIEEMKNDQELKNFSEEELKMLLTKLEAFQVGLSIMATNEAFASELTDEKIIEMLKDTCVDIVNGMKCRKI